MKFSATVSDLVKALALVAGVVESRTTIPIISHVLIRAQDGRVTVSSTDLDRECTAVVPAEITAHGATTVSCSILKSIVDKLPKSGTLTFSVADKATLSFGRSRFALQTLNPEDFPLSKPPEGTSFNVDCKKFSELLSAAIESVSTETTRFYLCGVYLHTRADGLCAASTDGHRMIRRTMPLPDGAENIPGGIVPTKGTRLLISLLDSADGQATVWLSNSRLWLRIASAEFSTALISGTFPDYERVIPRKGDPAITFIGQEFAAAVERAAATVPEAKAVAAGLSPTPEGLIIRVGMDGHDTAVEHIEGEFHAGTKSEVKINAKYLSAMTKVWGTAPISMQVSDPGSPVLFTSTAVPEQLYVIMPMQR